MNPHNRLRPARPDAAVLVAGGTGFIGSAALRALTGDRPPRPGAVKALVRRVPEASSAVPGVEYVTGDVTDPAALRGLCDGIHTVLHCVSYIGADEATCQAVNVDGTRTLLAEAEHAGVHRTVLVSTTAVYGAGPHRDLTEHEHTPAPTSATSRTRLLAEQAVLAAGGTVLRAPLVYGTGDVWFVPALAELLQRVPALPENGRARLSLVAVDDLARLLATLARASEALPPGTVHHAAHPHTPTLREFVALLGDTLGLPVPQDGLTLDDYLTRLRQTPGRASAHQAGLLAEDRWYRSPLWSRLDCPPGPGHRIRLGESAAWYRDALAPRTPAASDST
ncbi:NAD-dependent epimerase/dehydratase family protein [Streptomyces coacervatus]|nr:NAD-dependent epimerase/dehydratase family protein [Streptomyces coacervatus]MDF2271403.1 NAD-dependent epimerase/dehydratase family protein [Streptomyces coacervatus]